jgi:hypothetical protein
MRRLKISKSVSSSFCGLPYEISVALPKGIFHTELSTALSSKLHYPLVSLRPSSSCLRLLPRLPVTCIFSSLFLSLTCFQKSQPMSWINIIFCLNAVVSGPAFSCIVSVLLTPLYSTSQEFQEATLFLWDEADEFFDMLNKTPSATSVI